MKDDAPEIDPDEVTAEDVAFLNRETMRDLAVWGRVAGIAVIAASALGALAWLWVTVRTQQHIQGRTFTFGVPPTTSRRASLTDRTDAVTATIGLLVSSALTFGVGLALLLVSNHLTIVHGGTLSGLEEGDPFPGQQTEPPDE